MRRRLGLVFVRSSYTLDHNLGLVCDYAAAYPETHYNNKKCAVRSALWAASASALCAEPKHSTVGGSNNNNKHRKYRNCDRPSQLSQRDSYAVETPGTAVYPCKHLRGARVMITNTHTNNPSDARNRVPIIPAPGGMCEPWCAA